MKTHGQQVDVIQDVQVQAAAGTVAIKIRILNLFVL
jgi:hypothetical protein